MPGIPRPFGGGGDDLFDSYDAYVPENLPKPGAFLDGHDVLVDADHCAFHRLTRDVFEERTVYDMTFNYNLARLNLDTRHRSAGYRYARADDPSVLRAEFTPTTPFCPQSDTLTTASFRAWNGLAERHEYDLVRVGVDEMHHRSAEINARLTALEDEFVETGAVPNAGESGSDDLGSGPLERSMAAEEPSRGDTPF